MQLVFVLITGIFIGGITGYLGSLMLGKRMSLIGGPLGHLALPGIGLALVYSFDIFLGAVISITLGVIFIWFLESKTRLPIEALTGIIFASGVSLGLLVLPIGHAKEAIVGNMEMIGLLDMLLSTTLLVIIFLTIRKIYPKIILSSISEDLAKSKKVNVKKISFIYLLAIALVTALEVKLIGILLTAALFTIPASAARNFSKNLSQYQTFSILIGALSTAGGIILSQAINLPAGPLIILSTGGFFLISLLKR